MIITFKTLQQQSFKIEIDESETIKALKEKVEVEKGDDFPVVGQKLIYAGKILEDGKTIKASNIDEKNFIVVMVTKPKASTPPEANIGDAGATLKDTAEAPKAEVKVDQTPAPVQVDTSKTTTEPAAPTAGADASSETAPSGAIGAAPTVQPGLERAESTLVTGAELEGHIERIMSMGFDRAEVTRAMRASYNNPWRAVDYLLAGNIPDVPGGPGEQPEQQAGMPLQETEGQEQIEDAPPQVPAAAAVEQMAVGGGAGGGPILQAQADNPLAFLAELPQFQEMRRLVRENPDVLPDLLQQMGRANPQLLTIISQNQTHFVSMLNAGSQGAGPTPLGGALGRAAPPAGEGQEAGGVAEGQNPPPGYITVTAEEQAAINRLKAMGFPEPNVIQAFFACDKNEALAANLLCQELEDLDLDYANPNS